MYCPNCGKIIDDRAMICPYCGVSTGKNTVATESNTMAIVGFVLSFFIPFIGLICSILGLKKSKELDGKGSGYAKAGIIISVLSLLSVVFLVFLTAMPSLLAIFGAASTM